MVKVTAYLAPGGDRCRRQSRSGMPHLDSHQSGRALLHRSRRPVWRAFIFMKMRLLIRPRPSRNTFIMRAVPSADSRNCWRIIPPPPFMKPFPTFTTPPPVTVILRRLWRKTFPAVRRLWRRKSLFVRARKDDMGILVDKLAAGELPLRVTHNDTKLNNVMLDDVTSPAGMRYRPGYRDAWSLSLRFRRQHPFRL